MKTIWNTIWKKCPYSVLLLISFGIAFVTSEQLGYKGAVKDIAKVQRIAQDGVEETSEWVLSIINNKTKMSENNAIDMASGVGVESENLLNRTENQENMQLSAETESKETVVTNPEEMLAQNTIEMTEESEISQELKKDLIENEGKLQVDEITNKNDTKIDNDCNNLETQEDTEEETIGITRFEYYEPKVVNSSYYSDAGKVAITTDFPYDTVDADYFSDAAFIGDSRTVGISAYVGLDEADFFCENSMTIYKILEDKGVTYQKTGQRVDLKQAMQEKQYGKIYIMMGINELGYYNTEKYHDTFAETIAKLQEWQPNSLIYLLANLHVSREKNNDEKVINNTNLNDKNVALATLANGKDIFYLDSNPLFTDEEGFLYSDYSFDGVHLYAKHYDKWREFLLSHAVVR